MTNGLRGMLNRLLRSRLVGIFSQFPKKIMISVSNVSMRYGAKVLFEEVITAFTPGKRYGLTGPNGAGKTTFMKILTGELEPQKGTVVRPRKFGTLSQNQFAFDAYRVIDTVIMGNRRLWAAMEEREKIYAKPEMTDEDGMRLHARQFRLADQILRLLVRDGETDDVIGCGQELIERLGLVQVCVCSLRRKHALDVCASLVEGDAFHEQVEIVAAALAQPRAPPGGA